MNDMVEVFNRYHFLLIVKIDLTTDAKFTMKKCAVSFQNVTTDIIFLLTNFRAVLCRALEQLQQFLPFLRETRARKGFLSQWSPWKWVPFFLPSLLSSAVSVRKEDDSRENVCSFLCPPLCRIPCLVSSLTRALSLSHHPLLHTSV